MEGLLGSGLCSSVHFCHLIGGQGLVAFFYNTSIQDGCLFGFYNNKGTFLFLFQLFLFVLLFLCIIFE